MNETGKIQIYTGEGKGKTTAALGLALRAIGRDRRVFMIQFLKAEDSSGEHFAARAFAPMLTIKPMGRRGFIHRRGIDPQDREMARTALEMARAVMLSGKFDLVILDEVNVAVFLGLIDVKKLLEFMSVRPDNVELVLTGRNAHPEVVVQADSVIEMKKIKHYYDNGTPAREGIEF